MADPVIEMSGVWKIFGAAQQVALADAKAGASKADILERHKCARHGIQVNGHLS